MTNTTAAARKALRTRRLSEAAKRAVADGDIESVAAEYDLKFAALVRYMKTGDHMDQYRQDQVERTSIKVQTAAARKGEIAELLATTVVSLLNDVDSTYEPSDKEKVMKAAALAIDKYLAILGDPSFIISAQMQLTGGNLEGNDQTAALERLANRAGIMLPGMREIEQPVDDDDDDDAEDAELVDEENAGPVNQPMEPDPHEWDD